MVDQISPADREYSSSVVFQQFSRLPVTGKIPDPIIGQFNPQDTGSVDDFKEKVRNVKQSAQVYIISNRYKTEKKVGQRTVCRVRGHFAPCLFLLRFSFSEKKIERENSHGP